MSARAQITASAADTHGARAGLRPEIALVRLLAERRVLWLRSIWKHDPLAGYGTPGITEQEADWLIAGDGPDAEQEFYAADPVAADLSARIAGLTDRCDSERSSPLAALAREFHLTRFDRSVLALAAAPEFDSRLERLYAYLQDDVSRQYATGQLALALFTVGAEEREAQAARFHADAPLLRFRLLEMEAHAGPPSSRALRVDDRLLGYLRGVNRLDSRLSGALTCVPAAPVVEPQLSLLDRLAARMEGGRGEWDILNLVAPPSHGAASFAQALATRLGLRLHRLDPASMPPVGPSRSEWLRLVERDSILMGSIVYIEEGEAAAGWDWLEGFGILSIVGSRAPIETSRGTLAIALPQPAPVALWRAVLGEETEVKGIAAQFAVSPEAAGRIGRAAAAHSQLAGRERAEHGDVWAICRQESGRKLQALAERIEPEHGWADIVLPDDVLAHLREIAGQAEQRRTVYDEWGFGDKLARGRGITMLFAGPSGTGKTLAAEVIARALQLDLYRVDLAATVSKYIGETEKNLKRIFDAAEEGGAILFFDEADALFGKRTEVKDSHDRYANIEVNYLLQRMEDYSGLSVLATNRKNALDRSFLRRIRFLVDFPFPDAASRDLIWRMQFPPKAPLGQIDFEALARLEVSGGNIRNIALNAAFLAAGNDGVIGMNHIEAAARREYSKIDQVFREREGVGR